MTTGPASLRAIAAIAVFMACALAAPQAQAVSGAVDRIVDEAGRITLEREVLAGGSIRETSYRYDAGRLVEVRTTIDGKPERSIGYLYAPDGRLVSTRESDGGASGSIRTESGASTSWLLTADRLELRDYDVDGRLVAIVNFQKGELVGREERVWKDGVVQRSVTTRHDGTIQTDEYQTDGPARGLLISRSIQNGTAVMLAERYRHDDDGRLIETRRQTPQGFELIQYQHNDDGTLRTERLSAGATLSGLAVVTVRTYDGPTAYVEESYDAGALFARVRYEDGHRVSEEIIKEGVVVRTRQFQ